MNGPLGVALCAEGSGLTTALNAVAIPGEGAAPEWVELLPVGKVIGRDGREWVNDQPGLLLDAQNALARDIPVDLEHATELLAPKGAPAPAVGWIKELRVDGGRVMGRVEWTETGRNAVESKSYRYLSPVILYEKTTGRIRGITSVALTNRPNLYLSALNGQEDFMDLKQLLGALGLPDTATMDDTLSAVAALKDSAGKALNAAQSPSLDKFVPRADYDTALGRATNAEQALDALKKAEQAKAIDAAIGKALTDGKITPATEAYHRAQCAQDGGLALFEDYCKAAPVIADTSTLDRRKPDDQGTALNADERKVCAQLGLDASEYIKTAL